MTQTLRRAGLSDAAAVRDLTREAYAKWVPLIGREPKPMTADYAVAVQRHRIDLLYIDDELAALIETIPEAGYLLIENLAVAPRFQGQGLGQTLLAHADRLAAGLGYSLVRLYPTNVSLPMSNSTAGWVTGSIAKKPSTSVSLSI
jgi:GNAT superfamily N-acetyltransferase